MAGKAVAVLSTPQAKVAIATLVCLAVFETAQAARIYCMPEECDDPTPNIFPIPDDYGNWITKKALQFSINETCHWLKQFGEFGVLKGVC